MRLVVIGGTAGGLTAAGRARRLDASMEIVVLEKGPAISLSACGLPYFVEGRVHSIGELHAYTAERFAKDRGVIVRVNAEAAAIAHGRREVTLVGGERIKYDKLVIATGASGPPNGLHTAADAERLKQSRAKTAMVIGAGYIGLEAAEALRARGMRVRVFQSSPFVLGREDAALTRLIARQLALFRVELRLNTKAPEPGDELVVNATGVEPNVALAAEAGVELGRTGAIRVNERMETNLGGVYAAGDCAEAMHLVTGRPVWIPLGTTANKMGRVAGSNAAGRRERFAGIVGTSIVRVCGLGVGVTGLSAAEAKREGFDPVQSAIDARERPAYFRGRPVHVSLVADRRTRRLLGGVVAGEYGVEGRIGIVATAITNKMRVEDFAMLDLAYAPPFAPVWDPLLVAAQNREKLFD